MFDYIELALDCIIPGMKWSKMNERILDIGSGSGDVTVTLLSKVNSLLHVDIADIVLDASNSLGLNNTI